LWPLQIAEVQPSVLASLFVDYQIIGVRAVNVEISYLSKAFGGGPSPVRTLPFLKFIFLSSSSSSANAADVVTVPVISVSARSNSMVALFIAK